MSKAWKGLGLMSAMSPPSNSALGEAKASHAALCCTEPLVFIHKVTFSNLKAKQMCRCLVTDTAWCAPAVTYFSLEKTLLGNRIIEEYLSNMIKMPC